MTCLVHLKEDWLFCFVFYHLYTYLWQPSKVITVSYKTKVLLRWEEMNNRGKADHPKREASLRKKKKFRSVLVNFSLVSLILAEIIYLCPCNSRLLELAKLCWLVIFPLNMLLLCLRKSLALRWASLASHGYTLLHLLSVICFCVRRFSHVFFCFRLRWRIALAELQCSC